MCWARFLEIKIPYFFNRTLIILKETENMFVLCKVSILKPMVCTTWIKSLNMVQTSDILIVEKNINYTPRNSKLIE
jgi:hypothetical protein